MKTVREGKVEISVPEYQEGLGPKTKDKEVFYNPAMELNRDISISFLRACSERNDLGLEKLLDGMAATGIRGIRMDKELEGMKVYLVDISDASYELIQKNIEKNGASAKVFHQSIEKHLIENRYMYDYIDVDPFGSPILYYPLAARYVSHGGIVGVTATDTAVLSGTYPKTCWRRYSSWPKNNWCRHENGLRILISYCVREAARYDRSVRPILSYYDGHHLRTYLKVEEGAERADEALTELTNYEFTGFGWEEKGNGDTGPMWKGGLFSESILKEMEPVGSMDGALLETWKEEVGKPSLFYDSNIISKEMKLAPPPLYDLIDELRGRDWRASRTHFTSTGFKTDAPEEEIGEIVSAVSSG